MSNRSIARWRMYSQRLWGPPLAAPDEVVRWLGAVQPQEFAYAKWSIAQRAPGITESEVDRAFAEGQFLRTPILRPTWHFVSASDIRWLLAISGPRVNALNMYRYKQLDLDEKTLAKTNEVITKALKASRHLTRKELAERIAGAGIEAQGQRLAYIVMRAELEGVICSGVMKGKQHTYALLDERVPLTPASIEMKRLPNSSSAISQAAGRQRSRISSGGRALPLLTPGTGPK